MRRRGTKWTKRLLIYRAKGWTGRFTGGRGRGRDWIWAGCFLLEGGDMPLSPLTQQSCMCKHGRRPVKSKDFEKKKKSVMSRCWTDDGGGYMRSCEWWWCRFRDQNRHYWHGRDNNGISALGLVKWWRPGGLGRPEIRNDGLDWFGPSSPHPHHQFSFVLLLLFCSLFLVFVFSNFSKNYCFLWRLFVIIVSCRSFAPLEWRYRYGGFVHVYIYKYCYLDKNSGSPWLILTSLICHCFHFLFYTEELKFETFFFKYI